MCLLFVEHEPNQDGVVALANDIYTNDLIPLLLTYLGKFEFEVSLLQKQLVISSPSGKERCRSHFQQFTSKTSRLKITHSGIHM